MGVGEGNIKAIHVKKHFIMSLVFELCSFSARMNSDKGQKM